MQFFRNIFWFLVITFVLMNHLYAQSSLKKAGNKPFVIGSAPALTLQPGLSFPDYPLLQLPESYRNRQLPTVVDNSVYPYLRPVFQQKGASCGQAASVGYNFCYEIDRARNLPANTSINQYPTHFTWNFLNDDEKYGNGVGVSYFRSFEILKNLGCPNEATYGPITFDDPDYWMSGYDAYRAAMQNRIKSVNSINLSTPEGLFTLKNWLNDHLDNSPTGGVANFYIGFINYSHLPENSPEAGKCIVTSWLSTATHAMTIVGYNDSIRFDLNNDGVFTNDIDINGDGKVDVRDWEIGGVKFVNSYDYIWADSGFCYALYSSLALAYGEGGPWNNAAHVITVDPDYQPLLTLKARINHIMRGRLKITAGVNADTNAAYPSTVMEFPVFDYQGGDIYMCGGYKNEDKEIEIGLDITPLIGSIEKGTPARFFMMIDENDPEDEADGSVAQFSVISYFDDALEYNSSETPCNIINNGKTTLSVVATGFSSSLEITPEQLPAAVVGSPFHQQLSASTGFPPYEWQLLRKYSSLEGTAPFVPNQGEMLNFQSAVNGLVPCKLPFSFPFYGKIYDSVFVHSYGYMLLDFATGPYPYLQDAAQYLMQTKAIAPFMSLMHQISGTGTGIWYESTPEKAVFTWVLAGEGSSSGLTDNFSATLFPDGRIIFSYGALDVEMSEKGVEAISNGDGFNYQYCDSFFTTPSSCITIIPEKFPNGLSIDSQGLITSDTITEDLSENIDVLVTDSRRLRKEKSYLLITGPLVETTIHSGSDNITEPGETAIISLTINNITGYNIDNMVLKLTPLSEGILMADSIAEEHNLDAGQLADLPDAFQFIVSDSLSHETDLIFSLDIEWDGHSTEQTLTYPLVIRQYQLTGPVIHDDNNNHFDAGETCNLTFKLTYGGLQPANTFTGNLTSDDPFISISGPLHKLFDKTISHRYDQAEWIVTANPNTPPGKIVNLLVKAFSEDGDSLVETFPIVIGDPGILVIDLDKNHNSAKHLMATLKDLNVSPESSQSISSDIFNFKQLFVCLGTRTQNYQLSEGEADTLNTFLNLGNNLYMEGGATFGSDDQYPLQDRFRVDPEKQAWYHPADTLIGDTLTFEAGIKFDYRGDHLMGYGLIPLEPAFSLFTDKNTGYHFVVANDSVTYRTIASSVEFGGIFPLDGSTREEIMAGYLNFLKYEREPLAANFFIAREQVCNESQIEFRPNCSGKPLTYHWIFENGIPAESTDEVAYVHWSDPGIYNVSLTVSDGKNSNTLIKEDCIEVLNCNGIQENIIVPGMTVFPNPVTDRLMIRLTSPVGDNVSIIFSDLTGRHILSKNIHLPSGESSLEINLTGLPSGVYILTLLNDQTRIVKKIIKK
jgi:hypothetical protein